ncbi:PAS domain-containing protein [Mobilicoccus pelagius]|uniref:PAS domain-containing protein n=1 Tax=Mobilicoccus pelagius NBRC 104925 TaxID=1089455 RepID=H5UNB8_9MICO|nr:PAS domain-containing protein [Mobilicoccus pelagius]GAB47226.1 hypothetical protein MOPEL_007_00430 [Mobilicoccus pelagius NBRC 104925]
MAPIPTGRERTFSPDDLIVSKTDPKGRITYANDVFLRISGYEAEEVVGQPHNLVRHPAMPAGLFKLLWDTISDGREVFAYINNLAKNGDHYWVLAHVTTADDRGHLDGYHSSRRVPDPHAVRAAEAVYRDMLAVESRTSGGRAAAEAGLAHLNGVRERDGRSYDELVWSLIETGRRSA